MSYKEKVVNLGKVYLASPWFSDEQLERCEYVRDSLKSKGFEVFSPKDENLANPNSSKNWRAEVFLANVEHVKTSSFVLAITDGKDMGTIFEAGLSYAYNKPLVYFAETLGDNQFNLMLAESGNHVITSRDQLDSDLDNEKLMECLINNLKYSEFSGLIE